VKDEERDRLTSLEMYFKACKAVRRLEREVARDPENRIKRLALDIERQEATFHKAWAQGRRGGGRLEEP
jgi:hypothetical protein